MCLLTPELGLYLVFLSYLEWRAPKHPIMGSATMTFPLYLALAVHAGASCSLAALFGVGVVRMALWARASWTVRLWETAVDTLSVALALLLYQGLSEYPPSWGGASLSGLILASLSYLLFRPILLNAGKFSVPESARQDWLQAHLKASPGMTLMGLLGVPFGLLVGLEPQTLLGLALFSYLGSRLVAPLLDPSRDVVRRRVLKKVQRLEASVAEADKVVHQVEDRLDERSKDVTFLQLLAQRFAQCGDEGSVITSAVALVSKATSYDNLAVFLVRQSSFELAHVEGCAAPSAFQRLQAGLMEPCVARACSTRIPNSLDPEDHEASRLFPQDKIGAAFPLYDQGVLYVGRGVARDFSQTERWRLAVLGQHCCLALQVARSAHGRELALERESLARRDLALAHLELKRSQAQVVQSSKMAAVGQLAAGVAHEMNTPLGAVLLAVDSSLAVLHKNPTRAAQRLERALQSGGQLQDIVSKLLLYSRDRQEVTELLNLDTVVRDTLDLFGRQLELDSVTLELELQANTFVQCTRTGLQQMALTLLTNARDALRVGPTLPKVLRVETFVEQHLTCLRVSDNGVGISPEDKVRIFEPFFTTKAVGEGTGLGLSVLRELVQGAGGSVRMESELGQGSQFLICLPTSDDFG